MGTTTGRGGGKRARGERVAVAVRWVVIAKVRGRISVPLLLLSSLHEDVSDVKREPGLTLRPPPRPPSVLFLPFQSESILFIVPLNARACVLFTVYRSLRDIFFRRPYSTRGSAELRVEPP